MLNYVCSKSRLRNLKHESPIGMKVAVLPGLGVESASQQVAGGTKTRKIIHRFVRDSGILSTEVPCAESGRKKAGRG